MKSDETLLQQILDELEWDPVVDASGLKIGVRDAIVTLRGSVPAYAQKIALEKAVQRVNGARAIVVDVDVHRPAGHAESDEAIAAAARAVLGASEGLPRDAIDVAVDRGCVTLTGTLDWGYQRRAAELAVARLRGVVGIVNRIGAEADADAGEIGSKIAAALARRARADAERLDIDVRHGVVTLRGNVSSLAERRAAEGVAWATRGVREVVDQLTVG